MVENQDKFGFSAPCPTCGEDAPWQGNAARPFCSVTCKLIDLGVWLDQGYRVPGPAVTRQEADSSREE